jgi:hypothetical protein
VYRLKVANAEKQASSITFNLTSGRLIDFIKNKNADTKKKVSNIWFSAWIDDIK